MKMFVNVRNCVTTSATLPGIAERGIRKLKLDAMTIAMQGKQYWKRYFRTWRFISNLKPKPVRVVLKRGRYLVVINGFILIVNPSAS